MYVDVELISNNTYQNSTFTYQVPNKIKDKINVGSIVIVPFRNKDYKAIIVSTSNESLIENPKPIKKYLDVTLNSNQIKYLQQLAISYRLNTGILLYNFVDISTLKKQKVINKKQIKNIAINDFNDFDNKKNNVFYVPSLKIGKELYNYLSDYLHIDFYQRYGGKEEIDLFKNNKLKNVILLNTNFDKLIIDNNTNYYFYDSNNAAWKLPKLNNFNVVELSLIHI